MPSGADLDHLTAVGPDPPVGPPPAGGDGDGPAGPVGGGQGGRDAGEVVHRHRRLGIGEPGLAEVVDVVHEDHGVGVEGHAEHLAVPRDVLDRAGEELGRVEVGLPQVVDRLGQALAGGGEGVALDHVGGRAGADAGPHGVGLEADGALVDHDPDVVVDALEVAHRVEERGRHPVVGHEDVEGGGRGRAGRAAADGQTRARARTRASGAGFFGRIGATGGANHHRRAGARVRGPKWCYHPRRRAAAQEGSGGRLVDGCAGRRARRLGAGGDRRGGRRGGGGGRREGGGGRRAEVDDDVLGARRRGWGTGPGRRRRPGRCRPSQASTNSRVAARHSRKHRRGAPGAWASNARQSSPPRCWT